MKFSVLMSIYGKEDPTFFKCALDSIIDQDLAPDEIVVIEDGPLTIGLLKVLEDAESKTTVEIRRFKIDKNVGLGMALRLGVIKCRNELIARMDSDDIANKQRFAIQTDYFSDNPALDIVGSNVAEFSGSPKNITAQRIMPETHEEITSFSRRRNPFAHPSVMFRKSVALSSGGYRNYLACEDYDLWTRMISNGAHTHNIQKDLTLMRTSESFYLRRGGLRYLLSIIRFKSELLRSGYCSLTDFILSASASMVTSLATPKVRHWVYINLLRSK